MLNIFFVKKYNEPSLLLHPKTPELLNGLGGLICIFIKGNISFYL